MEAQPEKPKRKPVKGKTLKVKMIRRYSKEERVLRATKMKRVVWWHMPLEITLAVRIEAARSQRLPRDVVSEAVAKVYTQSLAEARNILANKERPPLPEPPPPPPEPPPSLDNY